MELLLGFGLACGVTWLFSRVLSDSRPSDRGTYVDNGSDAYSRQCEHDADTAAYVAWDNAGRAAAKAARNRGMN
jgi:hypothetical protein